METQASRTQAWREALLAKGAAWMGRARARGVDALGKLQSGAIDWQETLSARRATLTAEPRRLGSLQIALLERTERWVGRLADRARDSLARLRLPELPGASKPAELEPSRAQPIQPAEAEPVESDAARVKGARPKRPSAKRSSTKSSSTKSGKGETKSETKGPSSRRLVLPIAEYETLSARAIVAEGPRLTAAQREVVLEHERANKKRKSVLNALEGRLPS
ncbi:MAG: hypothetical protein IT378_22095 [Sandaracinaceae bacterium]|nr:hypothetical protein [Sandaracinaceae bacterium]